MEYQLDELPLNETVEEDESAAALELQSAHFAVGERGEHLHDYNG